MIYFLILFIKFSSYEFNERMNLTSGLNIEN